MSGRSPVRSPGRLKEEDAAAHAARVKEARAAYSRLSRAGGELNRELRPANPRKSSPVVGSSRNGSPGTSPPRAGPLTTSSTASTPSRPPPGACRATNRRA